MANKSQITNRRDIEDAASEALGKLALASDAAVKLVSQQASDALKVTTDAAAAQLKVIAEASAVAARAVDAKTSADHEAIIEIKGSLKNIEQSVKELKDLDAARKNNPTFTSSHEMRLIGLEASRSTQIILTGIGSSILAILVGLMFYHMIK